MRSPTPPASTLDPRRADEIRRVNAAGTESVLRSAAEAGLDPIVHVASYGALIPNPSGRPLREPSPVGTSPHPYSAGRLAQAG